MSKNTYDNSAARTSTGRPRCFGVKGGFGPLFLVEQQRSSKLGHLRLRNAKATASLARISNEALIAITYPFPISESVSCGFIGFFSKGYR
jgi:hypothetical protein